MPVKGVGRPGAGGAAGRSGGISGPAKAAGGGFSARIDKAAGVGIVAGASGGEGIEPVAAVDPVLAQVLALARQLRSGELKTPDDATQELVSGILREKVRLQSKLLTDRIVQQLKDDPRLSKTLERLWKQAENQE